MRGGVFSHQLLRETRLEIDAAVVQRLRERHALAFQEQAASSRLLRSMSHRTSRYVPSGNIGFSDGMRIPKLIESAQTTTYQHVESS
jgi:hypothetical protein